MKKGQTIGLVTSCIVTQAEQSQLLEEHKEDTQGITGQSNDMDTCIIRASRENKEKAGWKEGSFPKLKKKSVNLSIIHKGFQLDMNAILNADAKVKEAMIKLFLDNFEVLATVKDTYPLTTIQDILHSLQPTTVFSSLDACVAYHAVRIEPCSQACTALISPFGMFQ